MGLNILYIYIDILHAHIKLSLEQNMQMSIFSSLLAESLKSYKLFECFVSSHHSIRIYHIVDFFEESCCVLAELDGAYLN